MQAEGARADARDVEQVVDEARQPVHLYQRDAQRVRELLRARRAALSGPHVPGVSRVERAVGVVGEAKRGAALRRLDVLGKAARGELVGGAVREGELAGARVDEHGGVGRRSSTASSHHCCCARCAARASCSATRSRRAAMLSWACTRARSSVAENGFVR